MPAHLPGVVRHLPIGHAVVRGVGGGVVPQLGQHRGDLVHLVQDVLVEEEVEVVVEEMGVVEEGEVEEVEDGSTSS